MIGGDQLRLIEGFMDDALTEQELREVRGLLDSSPEFVREFQLVLDTCRMCLATCFAESAGAFEDGVMQRVSGLPPVVRPKSADTGVEARSSGWAWIRWAAAAALFAVLAGVAVFFAAAGDIGTVRERTGDVVLVRNGREIALAPGAAVRVGDRLRAGKGGSACVAYRDGTTLAVFAESQLTLGSLRGAKYLRLESGAIHMDVAKQPDGRPLEVATCHSTCIVRGTKFDVVVAESCTRLEVQQGRVEMRAAGQPEKTVMVAAGQHAVSEGSSAPVLHAADKPLFRSGAITRLSPFADRSPISVDIRGARKLYLVVLKDSASNAGNNSVWINPRLVGSAGALDLARLPWTRGRTGWRLAPVPMLDVGLRKEPLKVQGRKVSGIATHPTSIIEYDLPPGYDRFETGFALYDLEFLRPNEERLSRVIFEIYTQLSPAKLDALRKDLQTP